MGKNDDMICFYGNYPKFRHLNPLIYKKIMNTKKLIRDGVNPQKFVNRGGVDLNTYKTVQQMWQDKNDTIEASKQECITVDGKPATKDILGEEPPEDECLRLIKEKECLINYQDGYRDGFHQGYVDARKLSK